MGQIDTTPEWRLAMYRVCYRSRQDKGALFRVQVEKLLPEIGKEVYIKPAWYEGKVAEEYQRPPLHGVVVYVNKEHLYYTVRLDNGILESFRAV